MENNRLSPRRLLEPRPVQQEEEQQYAEEAPARPAPRRAPPAPQRPAAPWWHYQEPPKRRPIEEVLGYVSGHTDNQVPDEDVNGEPAYDQYADDQPQEDYAEEDPETLAEEDAWNNAIIGRLQELQRTNPNQTLQERRDFERRMYGERPPQAPPARRPAPRPPQQQQRQAQPARPQAPPPRRAPTVQERQDAYPAYQQPQARPAPRRRPGKFNAAALVLGDPDVAALAANDPSAPSVSNLPEDKVARVERLIAASEGRPAPESEYYGEPQAEASYDTDLVLDENLAGPQLDPAPPEPVAEAYEESPEAPPEPEAQ